MTTTGQVEPHQTLLARALVLAPGLALVLAPGLALALALALKLPHRLPFRAT